MLQIESLMDDLKSAILGGDLLKIRGLSDRIDAAVTAVDFSPTDSMIRKAQRNLALLEAALSGVKSARRRIAEVEKTGRGLTVYDENGELQTVSKTRASDRRF